MSTFNVLITGANRGIGLGLVKQFLTLDDVTQLFATCRDPEQAEELRQLSDSRLKVIQLEVTDDTSIRRAFNEVDSAVGAAGLNLLINNAGIATFSRIDEPDRPLIAQVLDVNAISPLIIAQTFLPLLRRASALHDQRPLGIRRAAIINISSYLGSITLNDTGSDPFPGSGKHFCVGYRASKSALNSITKTLSVDLKKDKILVISQCPGWVQTDMGGEKAFLKLDESTAGLLKNFLNYGETDNGRYFANNGTPYEF